MLKTVFVFMVFFVCSCKHGRISILLKSEMLFKRVASDKINVQQVTVSSLLYMIKKPGFIPYAK